MKEKVFKIFIAVFGVLSIAFSALFLNGRSLVVFADSQLGLTMYEKTFAAPCYIYVGTYDCQEDEAVICDYRTTYKDGIKEEKEPLFIVKDQESLDYFLDSCKSNYVFLVEQDAYFNYYDDALSNYFLIVTSSPNDFEANEVLRGVTISELKENYSCIYDVIVPDEFNLHASLADSVEPEFEDYEAVYITSIDNPVTVAKIKSSLGATDDIDGDVTNRIIVSEDNYTDAIKKAGETYTIKFAVSDLANNTTEITIHVKVEDIASPTITGPDELSSTTGNPLTIEDIKQSLQASDNVDGDVDIYLFSDKYTPKKSTPGQYEVTFMAKDSFDNKAYKTIIIKVKDNEIPTISGPKSFTKSTSAKLSISQIMASLSANDLTDGDISNRITVKNDGYTGHEETVGSYSIIFNVEDKSGNVSEDYLITINVKDTGLPIFYVDETLINVSEYDTMSHEQIVNFLINSNNIRKTIRKTQFIYDDYSKNSSTPGSYKVSVKFTYEDDTSEVLNLSVNVNEIKEANEEQKPNIVINPSSNERLSLFARLTRLFSKIAKNVDNMFANVINWFKKLFA